MAHSPVIERNPKVRAFGNFGSLISTLRPVFNDQAVTFDPKSEKHRTSSFVRPNSTLTIFPIPPLPLLMFAVHLSLYRSQTRTFSSSASSNRDEDSEAGNTGDQRIIGPFEDVAMLLTSPREAVARISSRSPFNAATYRASCEDTACCEAVSVRLVHERFTGRHTYSLLIRMSPLRKGCMSNHLFTLSRFGKHGSRMKNKGLPPCSPHSPTRHNALQTPVLPLSNNINKRQHGCQICESPACQHLSPCYHAYHAYRTLSESPSKS